MSPHHKYYLVTGEPMVSKIAQYKALAKSHLDECQKLGDEFGGIPVGNYSGIRGLQFKYGEKPPEGWGLLREAGAKNTYRPTVKMPGGRELQARLGSIKQPGFSLFQEFLTGDGSSFSLMWSNLAYVPLGYEEIGDNFLIAYPNPPEGVTFAGKVWEMPEEGVKLLSEAEYYRLKADCAK